MPIRKIKVRAYQVALAAISFMLLPTYGWLHNLPIV